MDTPVDIPNGAPRPGLVCRPKVAHFRRGGRVSRSNQRATRNLGIERAKLEAMITHLAHDAGWPVAVSAVRVLDAVWTDMNADAAAGE